MTHLDRFVEGAKSIADEAARIMETSSIALPHNFDELGMTSAATLVSLIPGVTFITPAVVGAGFLLDVVVLNLEGRAGSKFRLGSCLRLALRGEDSVKVCFATFLAQPMIEKAVHEIRAGLVSGVREAITETCSSHGQTGTIIWKFNQRLGELSFHSCEVNSELPTLKLHPQLLQLMEDSKVDEVVTYMSNLSDASKEKIFDELDYASTHAIPLGYCKSLERGVNDAIKVFSTSAVHLSSLSQRELSEHQLSQEVNTCMKQLTDQSSLFHPNQSTQQWLAASLTFYSLRALDYPKTFSVIIMIALLLAGILERRTVINLIAKVQHAIYVTRVFFRGQMDELGRWSDSKVIELMNNATIKGLEFIRGEKATEILQIVRREKDQTDFEKIFRDQGDMFFAVEHVTRLKHFVDNEDEQIHLGHSLREFQQQLKRLKNHEAAERDFDNEAKLRWWEERLRRIGEHVLTFFTNKGKLAGTTVAGATFGPLGVLVLWALWLVWVTMKKTLSLTTAADLRELAKRNQKTLDDLNAMATPEQKMVWTLKRKIEFLSRVCRQSEDDVLTYEIDENFIKNIVSETRQTLVEFEPLHIEYTRLQVLKPGHDESVREEISKYRHKLEELPSRLEQRTITPGDAGINLELIKAKAETCLTILQYQRNRNFRQELDNILSDIADFMRRMQSS